MSEDAHIIKEVVHLYSEAELFGKGEKAHELSNIVKQHALAGLGIAFIPLGGADIIALGANTWTMYVRINKTVGVSFTENSLKSIASGVITNLVIALPAAALGLAAESLLKYLPGFGTIGGIAIGAAVNVGVMYAAGKVYIKTLEKLIKSGKPLTEETVAEEAKNVAKEKSFIKEAFKEGKELAKEHQKSGSSSVTPLQSSQLINLTINGDKSYLHDLGRFGAEEEVSIIRQATHYQISSLTKDSNFDTITYEYKPNENYVGTDEVDIKLARTSNGTNPNYKIVIITIKFTITD